MAVRKNEASLASSNFTSCNDPEILYIDWTGEVFDESDEDDDWDDYFPEEEVARRPLDFN